jgi:ribosomal protein S18 acetylase RimI-like enzyme
MLIRNMIIEDMQELALLYKQFWHEDSDLGRMRSNFKVIAERGYYVVLCAIDNNKLVGSVMGIICDELYGQCKPFMVIENMIVDAGYRKRGIDKALISNLERIALERHCSQIILVTEASRADACAFYESVGYDSNMHKGYKKKL